MCVTSGQKSDEPVCGALHLCPEADGIGLVGSRGENCRPLGDS